MKFLKWLGRKASDGMTTLQERGGILVNALVALLGASLIVATLLFLLISSLVCTVARGLLFIPAVLLGICVPRNTPKPTLKAYERGNCKTCNLRR